MTVLSCSIFLTPSFITVLTQSHWGELTANGHLDHIHLSKPVGMSEAWQVFITGRIHWCFAIKSKAKTDVLKMEQCCSCPSLWKGRKLEEMAQTSCTKMQCLGFSSERCVGGWFVSLSCSSYDSRNSAGTFFWPWRNNLLCRDCISSWWRR